MSKTTNGYDAVKLAGIKGCAEREAYLKACGLKPRQRRRIMRELQVDEQLAAKFGRKGGAR